MALDTDAVLWDLLNDAPGEIYDVDDIEEEKFDVEQYINGNTDYWYKLRNFSSSITFPMLRTITTHPEDSIRFTPRAKEITQELNEYRRANGEVSLKEMARIFGLGETNCTHYYYGKCYPIDQSCTMRRGACVDLWGSLSYLVVGQLVTQTGQLPDHLHDWHKQP